MTGRDLVVGLERAGFSERRRSRSFVWLARDEQVLMVDEESVVPDDLLDKLLGSVAAARSDLGTLAEAI